MLYITLVGMQRETSFAPSCIPVLRKNYVPTRGASLTTQLQGVCKLSKGFKHVFNGRYELDKLTGPQNKGLKRDLLAMKALHAGKVHIVIKDHTGERYNGVLSLVNPDSTHKRLKNTILQIIHFQKLFNNEH